MLTDCNQTRRALPGTAPTALLFSETIKLHVPVTNTQATEQLFILKEAGELYISHGVACL